MGIFCIHGISFKPAKELLEKLGIEVWIKTDNDKYKESFAGLSRASDYLDKKSKQEICNILKIKNLDESTFKINKNEKLDESPVEKNMKEIIKIFKKNKILLSDHHEGFEKDFIDFIGSNEKGGEFMDYLKKKKHRNLHKLIKEQNLLEKIKITDENKNLPIIGFYYD